MPPKKRAIANPTAGQAALQVIPSNSTGKRAFEGAQDAAPKAKRISTKGSTPDTSVAQSQVVSLESSRASTTLSKSSGNVIEKQPEWAFDVTGKWTIDASKLSHDLIFFDRKYPDGPPPFTLEIKYANNPRNKKIGRQLWGTFRWGTWTGCMRFAPGHKYIASHLQFYQECVLKKGVWAGPEPRGFSTWNFRWKAKCDTEGIEEGTDEWQTQLRFSKKADGTLTLDGKMIVGGYKARKFSGIKTGEIPPPKGNDKTVEAWWNKDLKDPYEESRLEACRRCKGNMDDSDESETDEEEDDASMKRMEARHAEIMAREAKEKLEAEKPWPTSMTGQWEITPAQDFMDRDDATAPRYMKMYEETREDGSPSQYWAEFQFGHDWNGVMRFCPVESFSPDKDGITAEEFVGACALKDDAQAGPSPNGINHWWIKWRGTLIDKWLPESMRGDEPRDVMTTDISFKCGEDGKMSLSGVILAGCSICCFKGTRVGDVKPRGPEEPMLDALWEEKRFKEPPPPANYPWKSPLPSECVEKPPVWAWDVLGKWNIDAPDVIDGLKAGKNARFTMTIYLSNKKKPAAIGRQLWATFKIGSKVSGCMRFIPLPENSHPLGDVPAFEKACKLKKGVWPGDVASAKRLSFQKWGLRWRAKNAAGIGYSMSDEYETQFSFKRDGDGKLNISGVWTVQWQPHLWKAVKVEDGGELDGTETTVNAVWKSFASR